MATRKRKGQPADPEFAAEIEAAAAAHLEEFMRANADFAGAWGKRLIHPPPPIHTSTLHRHDDACWILPDGSPVPTEKRWQHTVWVEGRVCQRRQMFVAERYTTNPSAVR